MSRRDELTFAGLPACVDMNNISAGIAIIGITHATPYERGVPTYTLNASHAIRKKSVRYPDESISWDFDLGGTLLGDGNVRVVDCGDIPGDPSDPEGNRSRAIDAIRCILRAGAVPIVIGGDDSVPIVVFRAFEEYGPINILQIDAHIDWRHEINGVTEGLSSTMRRASEMSWVDKIVQIGSRGVGSARVQELEAAQAYGAQIVTAHAIHKNGVGDILELIQQGSAWYVTLDCDGLDPSVMPAVDYPSPGGLSYIDVIELLHGLSRKARIVGFNLVEFRPDMDVKGLGATTAMRIIWNAIGLLVRSPFLGRE